MTDFILYSESTRGDLKKSIEALCPKNVYKSVKMASKGPKSPKCRSESTRQIRKSPVFSQIGLDWLQTLIECSNGSTETGPCTFFCKSGQNPRWRPKYFENSFRYPPGDLILHLYDFFSQKITEIEFLSFAHYFE